MSDKVDNYGGLCTTCEYSTKTVKEYPCCECCNAYDLWWKAKKLRNEQQ